MQLSPTEMEKLIVESRWEITPQAHPWDPLMIPSQSLHSRSQAGFIIFLKLLEPVCIQNTLESWLDSTVSTTFKKFMFEKVTNTDYVEEMAQLELLQGR